MHRKVFLTLVVVAVLNGSSFAQSKKELFITNDGKLFTREQRDSIESTGNFVGITDSMESADSLIHTMFFYDNSILLTKRQKQFHGKDFTSINKKSLDGIVIRIDELRGKPILIDFWSIHCAPCIAAIPQLNELRKAFANDAHFIALVPEAGEALESALSKYPFDFTIIPDASELFEQMGIDSYPVVFFIDKNGIIKLVEEGMPVDLKAKPDGSPRGEGEPFKIMVYEIYSKILEKMIKEAKE